MALQDIKNTALQILAEERRYPTTAYAPINHGNSIVDEVIKHGSVALLKSNRQEKPRTILSETIQYGFQSKNYALLVKLLSRLDDAERPGFLDWMVDCMKSFPGSKRNDRASYPSWNSQASETPLIAEFLIRNGGKDQFFGALESCQPTPGIAVMVVQLEDLIALNYLVFSDLEYSRLETALRKLRSASEVLFAVTRTKDMAKTAWGQYGYNAVAVARHIMESCDALLELCRKARYLYLKTALSEEVNLEINQDRYVVEGFLAKFGFSRPLLTALTQAEKLNSPAATEFELKSSLGHLRSFMEQLHAEAVPRIAIAKKAPAPSDVRWGSLLNFLSASGFLSPQEERFVAGLYVLISDEAIHPLVAKREYARLIRNVVIEYSLLFLRKLEQLGIKK